MKEKEIKLYDDVFYYINEDGETVTVVGFKNSTRAGEVPNVIEGMKVSHMTNEISGYRCTSLKEITISNDIILESQMFFCSHSLEKVVLKSGVVLLRGTFESCPNLKEVILEKGVIIDNTPVLRCAKRNEKWGKELFFIKEKLSEPSDAPRKWVECFEQNLELPLQEGVKYQCMENDSIFSDCESLTEIEIPEGIEFLPCGTFSRCTSLCRVTLPKSLKVIGVLCFSTCENLVNIVIPEGVIAIGEDAFAGCKKLETVILPSTLTHIVGNPFKTCKSLKRIVVPEGMTGIDGSEELADEIYRYVSSFTIGYTSFNKKDFYSKKTWKQIFKSKASLITNEIPSLKDLKEKEDLAIAKIKEQGEFDKIKLLVDNISEYFLENLSLFDYKKKDISLLEKKIIAYIEALYKISKDNYSNEEMILKEVKGLVEYINEFDEKFNAIETEDRESICEIIDRCIILAGYPCPDPQIQPDFDITYEWREW